MKDLRLKIFQLTGKSDVFAMKISEVAQVIVEDILTDDKGCVSDTFVNLMAKHLHKFYDLNKRVWCLFAEICMQRISLGAMPTYDIHCEKWTKNYAVPSNFLTYYKNPVDKIYDFTGLIKTPEMMTEACVDFLYEQGKHILKASSKPHMKEILFTLIDDMSDNGEYQTVLVADGIDKVGLMRFAQKTLYDNIHFEDIIEHISQKDIWYKHLPYIKKHWDLIKKREFATKIGMQGPLKRVRLYCKVFL